MSRLSSENMQWLDSVGAVELLAHPANASHVLAVPAQYLSEYVGNIDVQLVDASSSSVFFGDKLTYVVDDLAQL